MPSTLRRFGRRALAPGLALTAAIAACDDPAGPPQGEPTLVEVAAGDDQVGMIGTPLATGPAVRVTDADGEPVAGVRVEWTVVAGGGSIDPAAAETDGDGRAEIRWTLGPDPGENVARATVAALDASVDFEATAVGELELESAHAIASGAHHSCALATDGTPFCWGRNDRGQLGDGTTTSRDAPTPVAGGHAFVRLSAGARHTCGLTARGRAYCWGANAHGALGDGTTEDRSTPVRVAGGVLFRALGAGERHSCGITLGDDAYCWGYAGDGQLGTGDRADRHEPAPVAAEFEFAQLDPGRTHTCALASDGRAFCWGINTRGGLGNGGFESDIATAPEPVDTELRFVSLSSGSVHTCAVSTGGGTYCWGRDGASGEIRLLPRGPVGSVEFARLSAGETSGFDCGLTPAGVAYCWGLDDHEQLGDGDGAAESCGSERPCATSPVAVAGGRVFVALGAGGRHACAIGDDGRVFCWGNRGYGQVGDGSRGYVPRPRPVEGGIAFESIAAGGGFSCGVDANGAAHCWGVNDHGELGTGDTVGADQPVPVAGSHDFAIVRSAPGFSCGLTADGAALCWGGYMQGVTEPTAMADAMTLTTFDVGGGRVDERACGVTPDGETYCWDYAYEGPASRVFGGDSLVSIAAGYGFQCGRTVDGAAYCWGANYRGQLGTGDRDERPEPAPVAGDHVFDALDAGLHHACGVTADGTAYCWGEGWYGQLGDGVSGTDHDRTTPHPVATDVAFRSIVAGEHHTCALTDAGRAYCWGANPTGELGDGTYVDRTAPVRVDTDLTLDRLAVGAWRRTGAHTCGITPAGAAYCWGDGTDGGLGIDPVGLAPAPVPVATGIGFAAGSASTGTR